MPDRKQKDYPCPICFKGFTKPSSVSRYLAITRCGDNLAARNRNAPKVSRFASETSDDESEGQDAGDYLSSATLHPVEKKFAELEEIFIKSLQDLSIDDIQDSGGTEYHPHLDIDLNRTRPEDDIDGAGARWWNSDIEESSEDSEIDASDSSDADDTGSSSSSDDESDEHLSSSPSEASTSSSHPVPRQSRYRRHLGPYQNERDRYVVEHPTAAAVGCGCLFRWPCQWRDCKQQIWQRQSFQTAQTVAEAELAPMLNDSGLSNAEVNLLPSEFFKNTNIPELNENGKKSSFRVTRLEHPLSYIIETA
ncbi:hypothetical protein SISSUDRAFT_1066161 [Sistotremastrum suecicum HHB10207 ss-3]|uniref:C2H2-type domain-containing protein n=1 Tax=Sistotremastrum suecicum HHB10207 ss-3 TaxID=1314776 RepID=A0A165YMJ4_9AGAM|nr:hypothetical protein SISSUDRAFT_1066161 [Sistotremastrum suecicum HHB10207 ss-3]